MKNKLKQKVDRIIAKNISLGILIVMIFLFSSCSSRMNFSLSSVVPAAQGFVKVGKDHNKNYVIHIHITNLAGPSRLQPSKQTYIVWMVSNDGITKNIGQLNSSTSFLSKKLKASLETVSSSAPAKIFITAENDVNINYPGNQVVLSTDVL
jgi:hypothetical protein